MISPKRTIRSLALVVVVAVVASQVDAQQPQPQIPGIGQPKFNPKPGDKVNPPKQPVQPKQPNPIVVYPQINTWPGIPASQINPPVFNPGPFYNPALNNPWINQTNFIPVNPWNNRVNNPFAPNPFNNPFVNNPFNNPFTPNPFLNNPFNNQFAPYSTYTPPIAIQQPGQLLWKGPDLQVNPWSGTTYKPLSGVAQTADGSIFYRVPGSGLPTYTGKYAPGTGLYYNPNGGTFLNPSSGVISKPGVQNVFIPWIP